MPSLIENKIIQIFFTDMENISQTLRSGRHIVGNATHFLQQVDSE